MSESMMIVSVGVGYVVTGLALLGVSLKTAQPKLKLVPVRSRRK